MYYFLKGEIMLASRIVGIGGYLPPNKVLNFELEKLLDTTDEWIQQRTGIQSRYWADALMGTSDLSVEAAKVALENAQLTPQDVDLLVVATCTPDCELPGTAALVQKKLGISPGVPFFDIRQACSGFVYGLSLADQYIKSKTYRCVLVIGAEVQSKALDRTPRGRAMSVLFGDGAGAVVLVPTEVKDPKKDPHLITTHIYADGNHYKELWIEAPGSGLGIDRVTHEMIDQGLVYPQMNGRMVFAHAVQCMPAALNKAFATSGFTANDVDIFLFHQANLRINTKIAEDMGIPDSKVHSTIQKFGNTTAATIPLGQYDATTEGKIKPGMLIAASAFGAGFTWASAIWRL